MDGWGGSPVLAPHYLVFFTLKHEKTTKKATRDHTLLSYLSWESRILALLLYIKQKLSLPPLSLRNYENVLWVGRSSETLTFSDFPPLDPSPPVGGDGGCGQSGGGQGGGCQPHCRAVVPGTLARWPAAAPGFCICTCPGPWQPWVLYESFSSCRCSVTPRFRQ